MLAHRLESPGRSVCTAERGIGLVELLVAMAVSMIVLTGVFSVMLRMTVAGGEVVQGLRLNQQLRSAMDMMTQELQRAGYTDWHRAWQQNTEQHSQEPELDMVTFYHTVMPLLATMGAVVVSPDGSCILYSYDLDRDGTLSSGTAFELFGFRLRNGAVQMKTSGSYGCDSAGWQSLTDDTVKVTELVFTLATYRAMDSGGAQYAVAGQGLASAPQAECAATVLPATLPAAEDRVCLERRSVHIALRGQLAADATVSFTLHSQLKIRNDRPAVFRTIAFAGP